MQDARTLPTEPGPISDRRRAVAPPLRRGAAALAIIVAAAVCDVSLRADAVVAPRPPAAAAPVELDRPLAAADAARYRDIFALQETGQWDAADRLIAGLADPLLLGHVEAQRYLHPTVPGVRYRDLAGWLGRYADHPDAAAIYRLAVRRKPAGTARPPRPEPPATSLAAEQPLDLVHPYRSDKRLSAAQVRKVQRLKRRVRIYVNRVWLTKTERLLEQAEVRRLFDRFELDDSYAALAAGWLYAGKTERALAIARDVAGRSGDLIPTANWTAGLAAWRLGDLRDAAGHFARLADAGGASAWNRSAGAYWAARAHLRLAEAAEADRWLAVATRFPTTFYGLLAQRRLGVALTIEFLAPALDAQALDRLRADASGVRAMALIQTGQRRRAEDELMLLADWRAPHTIRTLLAVTQAAELPRLGWRVTRHLRAAGDAGWSDRDLGASLYPVPPWSPRDGFRLDRALIYAFMRQESSFDPQARSPDGARGLMQLMPATASALDRKREFRGDARDELFDPALNLSLGQRYLAELLASRRVRGDLLRLAVAYNAGPGNLGNWERLMDYGGDPLLFIESLPTLETRLFAERVLANLWIYRVRLGQPTPSLDALAADRWPAYEPLDAVAGEVAGRP